MLSNPFKKFVQPRLPRAAIGLTEKEIAIVLLERRRGAYAIQRAGQVDLPRSLVRPGFDTTNVADPSELADILAELAASVGLGKRKR